MFLMRILPIRWSRRSSRRAAPSVRPSFEVLEERRLLSGGVLDPTFGTAGLVTTAIGSGSRGLAVATYPNEGTANDGKIVAAGDASTGRTNTEYMAVVRYNLDGTPDRTFGGTGEVTGLPGAAWAVQVQPDGKVLAAGVSGSHFAVVRYNANGSLDSSFGSTGKVITTISKNSSDAGGALVLQADGKIVVAGVSNPQNTTYEDLALVRYNATGALDTSFGTGGKVTTRFAAPLVAGFNDSRVNLAIDPNTSPLDPDRGKIIVGAQMHSQPGAVVVLYNTNGTLDTGFGPNHIGYVNLSNLSSPAVAVQSDDRIVVAGVVQGTTSNDLGLDRLNPDGTLDTSFGSGGVVVTSSEPNGDAARSVTLQADGKIVVAGDQNNVVTGATSFLVARYNTNGSLDTAFGVNGIATAGTRSIGSNTAALALEPDGRIVVAGYTQDQLPGAFSLARFLATGPQIGSFTATPYPVTQGTSLTLTAANVVDLNLGSSVTQVAFYQDANGDGVLEPATDLLLGYGTQTSPGVWTFVFTVNLAPGTSTLFVQAKDSYGVFSDPPALTLDVL
jgi:uncharacterized delta-60 repeat protein